MLQRFHIPRSFSVLFWLFLLVIGLVTGLIAFLTSLAVSLCLRTLTKEVSSVTAGDAHLQVDKVVLFVAVNLIAVLLSATLVLYVSPLAAGSGIPNMYAYLNGVDMPDFLNIRVALAKVPGSILAVAAGLCIGKEGPMLHVGSIVATWLGNTKLFTILRSSREQDPLANERHARELVACGVAAGLAAGFSAPVGGLLFALEMSTRWRSELTARTLFACAVVSLATQVGKEAQGSSTIFKYGSLLFFKDSLHFPTPYSQIPLMALLGVLGGLVGCMYTTLNIRLGMKRRSYTGNPKLRYLELALIGLLTTGLRLVLPMLGDCRECICDPDMAVNGDDDECQCAPGAPDVQRFDLYGCEGKSFNDMGVFMFNPQGYLIKALFATPTSGFSGSSLLLLFLFNYSLSILTYGAAIPAGLFTPSLITGGAFGQLFAFVVNSVFENCGLDWRLNGGFYALLGAASVLGGLFRYSVSFSVILAELTGAEDQLPFLMLVLIIAKGVGDRFNQNMLNHLCILLRLPYIGGHPESTIRRQGLTAENLMDEQYPTLFLDEDVSKLKLYLQDERYAAFPVLENPKENDSMCNYVGMITAEGIRDAICADEAKHDGSGSNGRSVQLDAFICRPLVIPPGTSLIAIHRMFTTTGLEYIPVMQSYGPLSGVITRRQLLDCQNRYLHQNVRRLTDASLKEREEKTESAETTLLVKDTSS